MADVQPVVESTLGLSSIIPVHILITLTVLKYVFNWNKYPWAVKYDPAKHKQAETEKKPGEKPFVFSVPPIEAYKDDPALQSSIFKRMNYPMALYTGTLHWLTLIWLTNVITGNDVTKWQTYVLAVVLEILNKVGIGVGVHRLYAHRTYEGTPILRFFLMILTSIANQDTIYHWARDHRTHHLFADTPADPHDSSRGFFFSHMGWLLLRKHPQLRQACKFVNTDDLKADPFVRLQQRFDPFWNMFWCFVFPSLVALWWGEDMFRSFLVAGAVRQVYDLHTTWIVNSVVHKWGAKPYQKPPEELKTVPDTPESETVTSTLPIYRDNVTTEVPWVSLLTGGEGWHSWHHAFPWDYAAAEMNVWQQFNTSKIIIDIFTYLGLAKNRRRALATWQIRKEGWLEEAKKAGKVSEQAFIKESTEGVAPFLVRKLEVVDPAKTKAE